MYPYQIKGGKMIQYTCPECGAIGASNYIPLCHICDYDVEMKPSHNGKILIQEKETKPVAKACKNYKLRDTE